MPENPQLRFLSLFVSDLAEAAQLYAAVLGVPPSEDAGAAPQNHPFATAGPVVFQLGNVALALYQCDLRATHPGDVGIGLVVDQSPGAMAERAGAQQGQVFFGPGATADGNREMAIFMLPDRHFFEVVGSEGLTAI